MDRVTAGILVFTLAAGALAQLVIPAEGLSFLVGVLTYAAAIWLLLVIVVLVLITGESW